MIAAPLPEVAIVPHVFTDADAQPPSIQFQNPRFVGGLEVAVFIEHVVSG
jgi:hypothetical protein